jgi:two-component system NtrC family sensor kinase
MLGFAVAAMLALGAVSLMALRAARQEHEATLEWRNEAALREKAERALRESQRMEAMGQLTGGVAHDFNNLLMVVHGNLQILRKRLASSTHDRQLDAIGTAIGRGVTLTRHLLAFSRRSALQPRTIDLGELMPALCELLSHSLRENIRLHCHVEPGTCPIKADPAELELALLNIAVNARDAMPGGGVLSIDVCNATVNDLLALAGEMSGEFVLIRMHDSGEGVPPAILNRVFEPFFTTKAPGKGTGLGLSQVYGFTRQSGGTVTLQSPPGAGTTVTLWLPRSTESLPAKSPARARASLSGDGAILVVEDDASVASVLQELLAQLGYTVSIASSGTEGLQRLESDRFDLLLTDVVMVDGINGLQLARTARTRYPRMPIIVMTGYAAEIARIAAEGFTVLTKPFDLETLATAIEAKLEGEALT